MEAHSGFRGTRSPLPTVWIGGFKTIAVTADELAQRMVHDCQHARAAKARGQSVEPKLVFSSNGQGISLAAENDAFRRTMAAADIIHADGMSVVFASKLKGTPLPERIATTDFFHNAARAAEENDLSFFILGATDAQNGAARETIKRQYPRLRLVGWRNGYFTREEEALVCAQIRESSADVVWVGLGKPLQEDFCVRNREHLAGIGWLKTCGGLYGFLSGDTRRAPLWVQGLGLEWMYRALQDPKRLAWRYLTTNPRAFRAMLRNSMRGPRAGGDNRA